METEEIGELVPPELLIFDGSWPEYEELLHKVFMDTIWNNELVFCGLPVKVRRHKEYKGRHFGFWHLTSEGEKEEERTPDFRRCERLYWVSWVIMNIDKAPGLFSWWENKRGSEKHVILWCEKYDYAVILAKRDGFFLIKTAYVVDKRRAAGFREERSKFYKGR